MFIKDFKARAFLIRHEEKKELEEMELTQSQAYSNRIHWLRILPGASNLEILRILTESKADLVA